MKTTDILMEREEGSILIVALILLVLLSIIGSAATITSRLEMDIATNEYVAKQNLYAAEATAMEGTQQIENGDEDFKYMNPGTPDWIINDDTGQNDQGQPNPGFPFVDTSGFPGEISGATTWNNVNITQNSNYIQNSQNKQYIAFFMGLAPGASARMGQSNVYEYRVFGRSNLYPGTRNDGWSIVEVGYRRAF